MKQALTNLRISTFDKCLLSTGQRLNKSTNDVLHFHSSSMNRRQSNADVKQLHRADESLFNPCIDLQHVIILLLAFLSKTTGLLLMFLTLKLLAKDHSL